MVRQSRFQGFDQLILSDLLRRRNMGTCADPSAIALGMAIFEEMRQEIPGGRIDHKLQMLVILMNLFDPPALPVHGLLLGLVPILHCRKLTVVLFLFKMWPLILMVLPLIVSG